LVKLKLVFLACLRKMKKREEKLGDAPSSKKKMLSRWCNSLTSCSGEVDGSKVEEMVELLHGLVREREKGLGE